MTVIEVTRLDGSTLYVNAEHIRYAEANPDTVLTFVDGKKLVIRETLAQVVDRVVCYKGSVARWAQSGDAEA